MEPVRKGNPDDNKGPGILAVVWSLTALTTIIVIARMYIRARIIRNVGADDYLIVVSLVMSLVYGAITTVNINIGYGKHAWVLDEATVDRASLLNSVSFIFGILSFAIPKLAVAAMLHRILNPGPLQRAMLWGLVSTATAVSVTCILLLFTMCNPPEALWTTRLIVEGKATCRDAWVLVRFSIFTGSISAFTDLYLAIYPSTVLMKLKMSLRKRLALCAALGLGAVATAMAVVKCTQLHGLAEKDDYTYGTADVVIWTNIESDVVIIGSCIPTLQPLLELILGKRTLGSYNSSRNRHKGNSNPLESSYEQSRPSRPRKSDLAITNVESQESILPADEYNNKERYPMGHIRRTDNVTVEYESRDPHGGEGRPPSW